MTAIAAPTGIRSFLRPTLLHLAWVQSVIATGGSLFYSEVMGFPPCPLCWYQRIAMYPLVVILGVTIWKRDDKHVRAYVLPLTIIGGLIALYQCAMTYGWIEEVPCSVTQTVSCTIRWVNYYGFITIPLMALVAFIVITLSVIFHKREQVA